jgi:hypothetical protein
MKSSLTALLGAALVAIGIVMAGTEHYWLRRAEVTEETVVELIRRSAVKRRGATSPKVRFQAADGSVHEFIRSYSTRPPGFIVGQRVVVAYCPRTFEGRILSFGQRFGFAAVSISVGLALTLLYLMYTVGQQFVPHIYQKHRAATLDGIRPA